MADMKQTAPKEKVHSSNSYQHTAKSNHVTPIGRKEFLYVDRELVSLGIHSTLVFLHATLHTYAGSDGACRITHAQLASLMRMKSTRQIGRLLRNLADLGLIEWIRGRDANRYVVLPVNAGFIAAQRKKQTNGKERVL